MSAGFADSLAGWLPGSLAGSCCRFSIRNFEAHARRLADTEYFRGRLHEVVVDLDVEGCKYDPKRPWRLCCDLLPCEGMLALEEFVKAFLELVEDFAGSKRLPKFHLSIERCLNVNMHFPY